MSKPSEKPPMHVPLYSAWIEDDEIRAVVQVLKTGRPQMGVQVEAFEQELAHWIGCNHVVVVSSATAALHLALIAAGIGPGDEVVVPAFSFPSTAQLPLMVGAKTVFCDVEYYTWNISPKSCQEAITPKTKAIIPVSAFGLPYDLEAVRAIADQHKLLVIGDNAGALGSRYWGTKMGAALCDLHESDGKPKLDVEGHKMRGKAEDMCIFSFHSSKILVTGEGGCLCTDNADWAARARMLREHGSVSRDVIEPRKRFRWLGYNYRMTDMQAAMGRVQLQKLDEMVLRRRALAGTYNQLIHELNPVRDYSLMSVGRQQVKVPEYTYTVTTPLESEGYQPNYQRYVICLEQHDGVFVRNELRRRGVDCVFGYYDVPNEPFVNDFGVYKRCPNSRLFHRRTVALPFYHTMTLDEQKYVVDTLKEVLMLPQPAPAEIAKYDNEASSPL